MNLWTSLVGSWLEQSLQVHPLKSEQDVTKDCY
jgi:hypothetical protein